MFPNPPLLRLFTFKNERKNAHTLCGIEHRNYYSASSNAHFWEMSKHTKARISAYDSCQCDTVHKQTVHSV